MIKVKKLSKNKKIIKIVKPLDFLVIFFIIFVASISLISMFYNQPSNNLTAIIKYDGELMYTYNLNEIEEPINVTVGEDLNVNILVESDGATVISSDCKDKLCVKAGKLKNPGQVSVCLPARVTVEIIDNERSRFDAIVR